MKGLVKFKNIFFLFFLFIFLFILRLDCESYYAELCLQAQNSFNAFI